MTTTKRSICTVLSISALALFLIFSIWDLYSSGEAFNYKTYYWRNSLIDVAVEAIPFFLLAAFVYFEKNLVLLNKRIFSVLVFLMLSLHFVVFYCFRGMTTDNIIYQLGYNLFDMNVLTMAAGVIKILLLVGALFLSASFVKTCSTFMAVIYGVAVVAEIMIDNRYINGYVYTGIGIAYVLFYVTTCIFTEETLKNNRFAFAEKFLCFMGFEDSFDDDCEFYDESEEEEPFFTKYFRPSENGEDSDYEDDDDYSDESLETETSYFYKKLLVSALCNGQEKVLVAHRLFNSLARMDFIKEDGVVYTTEEIKDAAVVLYDYGKELCADREAFLGTVLMKKLEELLGSFESPYFTAQAVSFAMDFTSRWNYEWNCALAGVRNFDEMGSKADDVLPF